MTPQPRTHRPRAYSYLRFSTPEQSKGDSFRRQAALSERYATEHALDLDQTLTFQDLGVSAYRGRNVQEGQLGAFIAAVDSGRVAPGYSHRRGGPYLVCSSAKNGRGCRYYGWRYWHVEAYTLLALSEVNWRELFPSLYEASTKMLAELRDRRLVAEAELEDTETKLAKAVDLVLETDSPALRERLAKLEADKARLTSALAELDDLIETEGSRLSDVGRDYEEAADAFARYNEAQQSSDPDEVYAVRLRLHRLLQRTLVGMKMIRAEETPGLDHQPDDFRPEWLHGVIELSFNGAAEHRRRVMIADDYRRAASFTPSGESETVKWMQADGNTVWMVEGVPVVAE